MLTRSCKSLPFVPRSRWPCATASPLSSTSGMLRKLWMVVRLSKTVTVFWRRPMCPRITPSTATVSMVSNKGCYWRKLSLDTGDIKSAASWLQTFPGSKIGLTALVTYPKWVKVESWINGLFSLTFQGNSSARSGQDDSFAPPPLGDWCSIFCP